MAEMETKASTKVLLFHYGFEFQSLRRSEELGWPFDEKAFDLLDFFPNLLHTNICVAAWRIH